MGRVVIPGFRKIETSGGQSGKNYIYKLEKHEFGVKGSATDTITIIGTGRVTPYSGYSYLKLRQLDGNTFEDGVNCFPYAGMYINFNKSITIENSSSNTPGVLAELLVEEE